MEQAIQRSWRPPTLAIGAVPAIAAPGGGEAVPSTVGLFELQNTVTTLRLTDEGYGYVDTEVCTAGDKSQQWQEGVLLPNAQVTTL